MSHRVESSLDRQDSSRIYVWDVPVRLFHWALVILMVALYITADVLDGAIELHAIFGRVVIILVLFRIVWGFVGSSYARFSQFTRGPGAVLTYARSLLSNKYEFVIGHNPLGGWMVLVLLATSLIQALLGLFTNDDILFEGPFAYLVSKDTSDYITGLHSYLFYGLLALVAMHIAAVIWHKLFKGEDLLSAMFSGYKEVPSGTETGDARGGGPILAVTVLIICALGVYWLTF
jgi:cytochrome b